MKVPTDTAEFVLYLDLQIAGQLRTKLYDKRDDVNLPAVKFPFIYSNIPAVLAYAVYIYIYTLIYTCLTPIPRFALRDKVTLRLLKLLF